MIAIMFLFVAIVLAEIGMILFLIISIISSTLNLSVIYYYFLNGNINLDERHFCALSAFENTNEKVCTIAKVRHIYRYNVDLLYCELIQYKGCKLNQNMFKTKEECEKACDGYIIPGKWI